MPSRNTDKVDVEESYYHVYARGRGKQPIFQDDEDYRVFLNLLKRYLSIDQAFDDSGRSYPHLRNKIELLSYCLMINHFHLLLYQIEKGAMSHLMRSVMTSYSVYFNKKYEVSGALFESRYRASMITTDAYLMHISRYIHLNPDDWRAYQYSSIHAYSDFLDDYKDYKQSLEEIKDNLANKIHIIK